MMKDGEIPEKAAAGTREGASACAAAPDRGARPPQLDSDKVFADRTGYPFA